MSHHNMVAEAIQFDRPELFHYRQDVTCVMAVKPELAWLCMHAVSSHARYLPRPVRGAVRTYVRTETCARAHCVGANAYVRDR